MDMRRKLHFAADIVYEEQLTPQLKRTGMEMFMNMDTDGDGSVSLQELTARCASWTRDNVRKMFRLLDVDNSGSLDFDECKALFFLIVCHAVWGASAWRSCDSCGDAVLDSIYTCSACLSQRNVYFDLCSNCYPAAVRSHVSAHRSQFERHDLKVASVIDMILTEAAREMAITTPTITHNHYYIIDNAMPSRSNSANAMYGGQLARTTTMSGGQLARTATRRLTQAVSLTSNISSIISACSIM